jgi:hypothetical protein
MSNALVLKRLFALAPNKPAPSRERTMPNTPTIIPRKPPELYISMTITKGEHIEALYETLQTFSRLLDEDD